MKPTKRNMAFITAFSLASGVLVGVADRYIGKSLHVEQPAMEAPLTGGASALLEFAYLTALVASLKPAKPRRDQADIQSAGKLVC